MGKKGKKPGIGKEKTEKKTAKSAEKRTRREDKKLGEEDDIDAILAKIQKEAAKKVAIQVDENVPAPSPRCNGSLTLNPLKETELILYGGECYNGDKTFVYGDLYRYSLDKGEWKHVSSPNSPPPRSAHQAVAWKGALFVFGGEFTSPNQERFHHYKDLWRLDLATNAWEQLQLKGGPSPRSGHRMVLWKHKLIVFGGFYDTLREVRYFNDLFVLDLDEYKWQEIKPRLGAAWPSPRSAFQLATAGEEVFLYGGYFKDSAKDKDSSDKGVVLSDIWALDPRSWEWSKVKRLGRAPGPRAGFSLAVHKKRAILFGGVVDVEEKDVIKSTFLSEMFAFQMDNRRWFTFQLRKKKGPKGKGNKGRGSRKALEKEEDEEGEEGRRQRQGGDASQGGGDGEDVEEENEEDDKEWGNDEYEDYGDYDYEEEMGGEEGEGEGREEGGEGKVSMDVEEKDKVGEVGEENDQRRQEKDKSGEGAAGGGTTGEKKVREELAKLEVEDGDKKMEEDNISSREMVFVEEAEKDKVASGEAVSEAGPSTLGGTATGMEMDGIGGIAGTAAAEEDGEATGGNKVNEEEDEDESPSGRINASLVVAGNTLFVFGGMMEIGDQEVTLDDLYSLDLQKLDKWKCLIEASHSEWVEVEDDDDDEEEDEEGSGEEEEGGEEDEEGEERDETVGPTAAEAAAAILRGEGKRMNRKERKAEIDRIRAELGLADSDRTPLPAETLREFFTRTSIFWQKAAYERTQNTGKELRKDGFDLCELRFKELRPVLDELEKLEADQKAEEEEAAKQKAKDKAKRPAGRR